MNIDLPIELRNMGDSLAADYKFKPSTIAYQAAHMIEHLQEKVKELEGMLEDSDHFRDHWYDRYLAISRSSRPA